MFAFLTSYSSDYENTHKFGEYLDNIVSVWLLSHLSKDKHKNTRYPICSSYTMTLTLLSLIESSGLCLIPWNWVVFLLLWLRLKWKWGYAFHKASSYKAIHLLPCVCACLLAQLCLTLGNLYSLADYSLSGSSAHVIFQARRLEWVTISSFRGSSQHRDRTHISCVSCIGRQILYLWATQDAPHLLPYSLE